MSLSIPVRFSDGQTLSASQLNSVNDAIANAHNSLDTTVTSHTSSISTTNASLTKHGSRAFYAYAGGATTVLAAATTTIALNTEVTDPDAVFGTNKYIPAQLGYYLLTATVRVQSMTDLNSTATLYITINASGTTVTRHTIGQIKNNTADVNNFSTISGSIILQSSNASDEFYIEVAAGGEDISVSQAIFSGVCVKPS